MNRPRLITLLCTLAVAALFAPSTHATAPGSGVRGTLVANWGSTTGAPITSWDGSVRLVFDPSAAARLSTISAINTYPLGEAYRPVYAPQIQAVRATELTSNKNQTVICTRDDLSTYETNFASNVVSIADNRIAFEILPPVVDLLTGRGTITLLPAMQANSSGWYIQDRFVLPGRWNMGGVYPCPEAGGSPSDRLPRIISPLGQAAAPYSVSSWINGSRANRWPVRKTASGWRVMISSPAHREVFSDSPFGPQDTQSLSMSVSSELYLAGGWAALQARCHIPAGLIARSASARIAVSWARKAGFTSATYAGVKRIRGLSSSRYVLTGPAIGMGSGMCMRGQYRVWRYVRA